jgi:hypothetical protein
MVKFVGIVFYYEKVVKTATKINRILGRLQTTLSDRGYRGRGEEGENLS